MITYNTELIPTNPKDMNLIISLMEEYIGIMSEVNSGDKEDAQNYYRTKYMFNDNIINESKN